MRIILEGIEAQEYLIWKADKLISEKHKKEDKPYTDFDNRPAKVEVRKIHLEDQSSIQDDLEAKPSFPIKKVVEPTPFDENPVEDSKPKVKHFKWTKKFLRCIEVTANYKHESKKTFERLYGTFREGTITKSALRSKLLRLGIKVNKQGILVWSDYEKFSLAYLKASDE